MTMQAIPRGGYKQQPRRIPRSLGFARYTLSFDGVDDYVHIPYDLTGGLTGLTVEARVKGEQVANLFRTPGNEIIFHFRGAGFYLTGEDGSVSGYLHYDYLPPLNTWVDLAATWANPTVGDGMMRLYQDEVKQVTELAFDGGATGKLRSSDVFRIGHWFNVWQLWFKGLIAVVRVYNRALSAEERKWNVLNYHNPIRNGLILWLPMEEGTGEVVYDKSGYGNNGTLLPAEAGPTWERLRQWELRAAVE